MDKQQFREYFAKRQQYIKYSKMLEEIGVSRTNFSLFLNGADNVISLEKLKKIKEETDNIVVSLYK